MSAMAAIYVDVISPLGHAFRSPVPLLYCKVHRYRRNPRYPAGRHSRRRALAPGRRRRLQLMFSRNRLTTQAKQILLI